MDSAEEKAARKDRLNKAAMRVLRMHKNLMNPSEASAILESPPGKTVKKKIILSPERV